MNSPFSLPRSAAIAVFAILISLLGACGQRGPLYLQAKPAPAPAATPAALPASTPASTPLPVTQ
ncbi:MAG: lipoprotein [Oxalobacteraceae bacterium]|nr:lipoprotein [Oxalobacteraceae bacterium]